MKLLEGNWAVVCELLFEIFEEKERMKTLFDQPLSHRDDPITSYLAAENFVKKGSLKQHEAAILKTLKTYAKDQENSLTSAELAVVMGPSWSHVVVARRLRAMQKKGLIEVDEIHKRHCKVVKSLCVTWFVK